MHQYFDFSFSLQYEIFSPKQTVRLISLLADQWLDWIQTGHIHTLKQSSAKVFGHFIY